ncbi:hypothetical protein [Serratia fonticola]|uniref:hypothetical protein n=1 Tax=Serratia fonticola TaxID=47917 RepID=UPI00093D5991|nr:hypothetical protein [Serratia fonticola]OKP30935.1 hypothetical protein BSQ40_03165 [Serratia fonticola]
MTISTVPTVPTETLKDFIKGQGYGVAPSAVVAICEQLLAVREAQSEPVAVLDIQRNREDKPFLLIENAAARKLPDDTYQLYTAPPAPALHGELLEAMAEVIRISDRDHEAWIRAKNAISVCRVAMLIAAPTMIQEGDDNQLENNSDE